MTRFIHASLIATGLVAIVGLGTANAQITSPIEFKTSFPFTVGNTTVPAGNYTIRRASDNEDQLLELQGMNNHVGVFFETVGAQQARPSKTSEVVFKRYGTHYVLKDIWLMGDTSGAETVAAFGERHHAKHGGTPTEQRVSAVRISEKTVAKKESK